MLNCHETDGMDSIELNYAQQERIMTFPTFLIQEWR